MRLRADKPIESKKQDAYDREVFADNIAAQLCLDDGSPSIVIGLTAPWGYGKTSCLNLIRETLYTTSPKPIIVEFNPWIVTTVDALLESFFSQFLSTIGQQLNKSTLVSFGESILKYAKHIKPLSRIPHIGGFVSIFTETIENIKESNRTDILNGLDVSNQKCKINEIINKLARPIVVLIDDLDRLPPDQLRSVIQLIKAVCDFERTSFLISYDPKPVAKSLSYDGTYDGFQYLEKIVQTEYRLPKLTSEQLLNRISEDSLDLTQSEQAGLSSEDKYLLSRLLESTDFIYLFESPRDIHRLFNKVKACLDHLAGEVVFPDILFLCGIELKAPELFKTILEEPYRFFAANLSHSEDYANACGFYSRIDKSEDNNDKDINKIVKSLNYKKPKSDIIRRLIEHHFTELKNYSSSEDGYTGIKRISNKTTLLKAVHLGLVRHEYSYQQAKSFLECNRNRKKAFTKVFTSNQLIRKLEYIQSILDEVTISSATSIIKQVYNCLENITIDSSRRKFFPASKTIGDFFYEICQRIEGSNNQYEFIKTAITSTKHLAIPEALIMNPLSKRNIWSNGVFYNSLTDSENHFNTSDKLSNSQLYQLTSTWLQAVQKASTRTDLLNDQLDPISVFYRWGQLNNNNFAPVQSYVINRAKQDHKWFIDLSHSFHQQTGGASMFQIIPFDTDPMLEKILKENQSTDSHSKNLIQFLDEYRENLKQKNPEGD